MQRAATLVTHVPSLSLTHVDTHNISELSNTFYTTGAFTVSSLLRGATVSGQREREQAVSVTSKAAGLRNHLPFRNRNGDMLHFCKLARHSEIVPLINNLKLSMVKSLQVHWKGTDFTSS